MNIFAIGINHKVAPIEIREKFYLNEIQKELLLSDLKSNPSVLGSFILSTCNRTEIYLHLLDNLVKPQDIIKLITAIKKNPQDLDFAEHFYFYKDNKALEHFLKVITGLDSLVLGEKQILGQVKAALEKARDKGMLSKHFNLLSNIAIRAGKKAQNETDICLGGSSVSWAAITLAEQQLKTLENRSLLIIGAGKMSDLAVGQISSKGFKQLYVMNRTRENAEIIVGKYGGTAASFADIKEILTEVDLCICAADAPHYILEKDVVEKVMQKRAGKELLLIDISMPRNIDPKVTEVPNTILFKIDDLENVVEENMKKRRDAVAQVESIVSQKLNEYFEKISKIQELDTLSSLKPSA